jgi:hypothetical protein
VRLPPSERFALLEAGLLRREPFYCCECGRPIDPGGLALCDDGYQRVYGEFVLSESDVDGHDCNWPTAHVECLPRGQGGYGEVGG